MALPPLYKYLDIRGAKLTLDNKTFKHSKPVDFNDVEDLKIQSILRPTYASPCRGQSVMRAAIVGDSIELWAAIWSCLSLPAMRLDSTMLILSRLEDCWLKRTNMM
jgi:hypothetical protein